MTQAAHSVEPKKAAKPKPPKRRLWQDVFRWTVIAVLLVLGAYITLPWWLPTSLLRNFLVADLSRQAGSPVSIGSISASWGDGLEIRNIVFDSPAGFEPDPLLKVSRLRADFSPLSFLLAHKLEFVEIEDPHLRLQIDAAGHNNAAALSRLQSDVAIRRISIRQATMDVQLPDVPKVLRLEVGDLQMLSGKLSRLTRLTMSAALRQESAPAPLSLRFWAEPVAQTAADASFNFTNVQLAELPLAKLLGLPLTKLGGACSGRLDLKVNDRGVVDHFELALLVRQLDLESAANFDLPQMDEARLDVTAVLDPLSDQVNLKSVQVRVPGVDLAGKAMLMVDIDASQGGQVPTLIQSIDLEGKIHPSALAAMVLGRPALKGDLQVQGPLDLAFHAHRQEQSLRLDFSADATAATIRKGTAVLKPDARRLRYELQGVIDDRGWRLSADRTTLLLGDNQFAGRGSIREVAQLLETYSGDQSPTMQRVLSDVGRLAWNGTCQISDLQSIRDFCPPLEPLLRQVTLHGTANGSFDLDHTNGSQIGLRLDIPGDAQLAIDTFVKPQGKAMQLALRGTLNSQELSLSDVLFEAGLGHAYVRA